ncbi:hypothetical protein PU629_09540 [Pullulanibacillus sp. KACC 23026]|uniref:hypothetical protein n=1 Tax=Pullulanibacillus sp. KACC 23026 TaxID=3028315 RepID=UPI0023AFDB9E|nr:hypothetical protein [Pullulanibacillus sp. KACC 23026]WEG14577.1 hypothetical protein PU629_09540 [Pullulanibacillus sp. KACC 23026]
MRLIKYFWIFLLVNLIWLYVIHFIPINVSAGVYLFLLLSILVLITLQIIKLIRTHKKKHIIRLSYLIVLPVTLLFVLKLNAFLTSNYYLLNFKSIKEGKTTFYFQKKIDNSLINDFNKGILIEKDDYKQFFGSVNLSNLRVVFYPNLSKETFEKGLLGEYYLNNIILIDAQRGSDQTNGYYDRLFNSQIESVSAHEYNHYLLQQFLKEQNIPLSKIPVWFKEGLARYTEDRCDGTAFDPDSLEGTQLVPFEKLKTQGNWKNYTSNNQYNPYQQSGDFIAYILVRNGKNTVYDLLSKLKTVAFEQAFKETTGQNLNSYENQYFNNMTSAISLWKQVDKSLKNSDTKKAIV